MAIVIKPYYEHKEVRESREGLRKSSHLPHNELLFSIHLLSHQPQIFSTSLYHLPYPPRPPPPIQIVKKKNATQMQIFTDSTDTSSRIRMRKKTFRP